MKQTIENNDVKLCCYASGSGCLSFTWASVVHPYPASSRPVLLHEVKRFLRLKANKGRFHGHTIFKIPGDGISLIPIVQRVGIDELLHTNYEGKKEVFTYKTTPFEGSQSKEVHYGNTDFFFDLGDGEKMKVQHISTRLRLIFYLKNEGTIYKTEAEAIEYCRKG